MDPDPTLRLTMEKGPLEGQTVEFVPGSKVRIGRIARGNNLTIKDAGISTKHLAINFQDQSGRVGSYWTVSDLGSSNGTVLNSYLLEPFAPVKLSDGDVIKVGECTSIRVGVTVVGGEEGKRGRRNPRRGGKLGLGVVDEKCELELGKIESNENLRGGGGQGSENGEIMEQMLGDGVEGKTEKMEGVKKTKSKKKEEILVEKNGVDEVEETEKLVEKLRPRRGRPAKKKEILGGVSADFNQNGVVESLRRTTRRMKKEEMLGVSENFILKGAEKIVGKKGQEESSKRVTRSIRGTTSTTRKGDVEELGEDVGRGNKITRKGTRTKRNLVQSVKDDEAGKEAEIVDEKLGLEGKEINEEKEDLLGEEVLEEEEGRIVDGLVGEEQVKSGIEGCGTLASCSGVKADDLNKLDLEKVTLGEWFDYLEVYLPKQIIDATEEMVLGMRQKAEKFHEFTLQQKSAKEKVPVG